MLTKTATLQWTLQDISGSKFACTVKSACTRNPSLRGSQGMQDSNYIPYLVRLGTTSGLESAHLILEGQLAFLPAIPDQGTFYAHSPSCHSRSLISWIIMLPFWQQPSPWLSQNTCRSARQPYAGPSSTAMGGGLSMQIWRSSHCGTTGLWQHTDLHQRLSPSFPSAFSQLYKPFHVRSLLGYPSWCYRLDVQPWKGALEVPSAHLCTSNEGHKSLQSPEISKYVKKFILRHFCYDFAMILLKTKGWLVCQNRWNSSFGEQEDSPG